MKQMPLIVALTGAYNLITALLIESGADINIEARNAYDTPTALVNAIQSGHKGLAQLIIERGACVNAKDKYGSTALAEASGSGYKRLATLLTERGVDIKALDTHGRIALIEASAYGHKDLVTLLIKRGVDVNAKDGTSTIALIKASYNGHKRVAMLLIDRGADVNAPTCIAKIRTSGVRYGRVVRGKLTGRINR